MREYILRQVIDFHSLMIVVLETFMKRKKRKKKNVISKLKIGSLITILDNIINDVIINFSRRLFEFRYEMN